MSVLKFQNPDGQWVQITTIKGEKGEKGDTGVGVKGDKGDKGNDGHSPVITASKQGKVTTIKADDTTIATINDGNDGSNGINGHTPAITATKENRVTTVNVDGEYLATINDGNDGATPVVGVDYFTEADKENMVSDVFLKIPQWARSETKPSYSAEDVGALANDTFIPSKTSDLTNDTGFITNEYHDDTKAAASDVETLKGYFNEEGGVKTFDKREMTASGDFKLAFIGQTSNKIFYNNTVYYSAQEKRLYANSKKVALVEELPDSTSDLTNDSGFITSSYHDNTKQDAISDLDTIRSGAELGATALQSYTETDPIFIQSPAYGITAENMSAWSAKQDAITTTNKLNYNLLDNTPTIPAEITESIVSGWGFTKNTGTYSKPEGGIPASDLAETYSKSDHNHDGTYLKSYTETDPTVPAWAKEATKPTYTAAEVGALPDTTVIPTEDYINGLIDAKLGVIENGTY